MSRKEIYLSKENTKFSLSNVKSIRASHYETWILYQFLFSIDASALE